MGDLLNLNLATGLGLMVPQLIVFGLALALIDARRLFAEGAGIFTVSDRVSLVGYSAAMVALYWQDGKNESTFNGMFRADGLTVFLSVDDCSAAAILTVMISASYVDRLEGRMPIGEFYVLLAFSFFGALLVSAAGDLVMIFVGIELRRWRPMS